MSTYRAAYKSPNVTIPYGLILAAIQHVGLAQHNHPMFPPSQPDKTEKFACKDNVLHYRGKPFARNKLQATQDKLNKRHFSHMAKPADHTGVVFLGPVRGRLAGGAGATFARRAVDGLGRLLRK